MKKYNTSYISHDEVYKINKKKGLAGWGESSEDYEATHEIFKEFLSKVKIPDLSRDLDLGCGAGNNTIWFAKNGFKMSGIDIAPTAIEWAKERVIDNNLDIDFHLGSAISLDKFEDDYFDFVIDSHCLHCIIGADREILFNNVVRTLKMMATF